MNKTILFSLSALLLFINADCKDDPVKPVEIKPGRRDYVWTVDTLTTKPGDIIYAISGVWGSSPKDVWMIASADAGYELWHYDGIAWTRDSILLRLGPRALYGFDKNNVWVSNISNGANFWRFDGVSWKFFSEQKVDGFELSALQSIYGESANNIYAAGYADRGLGVMPYKAIVFHYDGSNWNEVNVGQKRMSFEEVFVVSNVLFLRGTVYEQGFPDTSKVLVYKNSSLQEIYSSIMPATLSKIRNEIYVGFEKKIYAIDNKMQLQVWKDFSNTEFIAGIQGRSEKDFFGIGKGGLMHYNGANLETILPLSSIYTTEVMIFENDIVFGFDDYSTGKHFMVRGTLKN